MPENCIFCKIINKEISVPLIFENNNMIVIADKYPKAPIHLLAIPKVHIASLVDITREHKDIFGDMMYQISQHANQWGLEKGFKVVNNCGENGGQEIYHIHWHILGGKKLKFTV